MDISEKEKRITKLRKQIAVCQRCSLHQTRTQTVPGEGDIDAEIMFIGEAPGRNEDLQGKPFVGRAGAIFDQLLESVNLSREQIYLCNILKCHPPQNRNPLLQEIQACVGSLNLQLKIINPLIICTLGNFATTFIFDKFSLGQEKISAVAGKVFDAQTEFGDKKILPLFHPAVVTYNGSKLDQLMDDFRVIPSILREQKNENKPKEIIQNSRIYEAAHQSQDELW